MGKKIQTSNFKVQSSNTKGFTLIELLITLSIIGILATFGVVSYTKVLSSGRDTTRKADLASIQSALEQYRADQGYYPRTLDLMSPLISGSSFTGSGGKVYLKQFPKDPNKSSYSYRAIPSTCVNFSAVPSTYCTDYCLYASLESLPSGYTLSSSCSFPPAPWPPTAKPYNFAVSRP